MPDSANIARYLGRRAAELPDSPALKIPRGRSRTGRIDYLTLTFAELDAEVEAWVVSFRQRGVQPGDRVLVMVRQGLPLIAAAFALFKHGAVPIVIDPGMGLKNFLTCVEHSHPRILLGIPFAQLISRVFRRSFQTVKVRLPASGNPLARLTEKSKPDNRLERHAPPIDPLFREATDLAAILFTSGSTGPPKGVCYEHGMFDAQVRLIQATYQIEPGEIDLPMLPIFALFNPALGMTTVVPEIDPRRPSAIDPAKIVQAIQQEAVTNSFGSPTLWNKISQYCIRFSITLPSLKRVLCAGAPVPASLWERSERFLPNGQIYSPYGATEALPVSSISAREISELREKRPPRRAQSPGAALDIPEISDSEFRFPAVGTCVGRPAREMTVKIIALQEGPIDDWREILPGNIGEIIVSGPVVTKKYDGLAAATAAAKIQRPTVKFQQSEGVVTAPDIFGVSNLAPGLSSNGPPLIWHRMGDCGYFDSEGRLWFCGRKVERVETLDGLLFTEPCEQIFRGEPGVARCALVGLGERPRQIPAMVIEPENHSLSAAEKTALVQRLRHRASKNPVTRMIDRFYFHPSFPVDVRHNAKIHRLTLAKWAARQKAIA